MRATEEIETKVALAPKNLLLKNTSVDAIAA